MGTIASKMWKDRGQQKPLKRILRASAFSLALLITVGGLFGAGYFSGKYFVDKSWSKKYDDLKKLNEAKVLKNLYPALEEGTTPTEYTGWVDYTWTGTDLKLSHPSLWEVKIVSANQIDLITPDKNFSLQIAYASKKDNLDLSLPKNYTARKIGQLEIMGTNVEKDSMVVDGISKAFAYPQSPIKLKNNSYFWAIFSALKQSDSTNLEELDSRSIGEKILRSIKASD